MFHNFICLMIKPLTVVHGTLNVLHGVKKKLDRTRMRVMIINYADRAHACRSGYPVFTRVKINGERRVQGRPCTEAIDSAADHRKGGRILHTNIESTTTTRTR